MTSVAAQFYVKDREGKLVPAIFATDSQGQFVTDPNSAPSSANAAYGNAYFDASGNPIENANPNNYLVVPANWNIQDAITSGNNLALLGSSSFGSPIQMISAFEGSGSLNLQRNYIDANGDMVYGGTQVPMFQDAASFELGIVAQQAGYGALLAQAGGTSYAVAALWNVNETIGDKIDNNARNMGSIDAGAEFDKVQTSPSDYYDVEVFDSSESETGIDRYDENGALMGHIDLAGVILTCGVKSLNESMLLKMNG